MLFKEKYLFFGNKMEKERTLNIRGKKKKTK